MSRDCRTCVHNTYLGISVKDWVSCSHPITLRKMPQWEAGDPAFVNLRTGDLHISSIGDVGDCPTWESAVTQSAEDGK